MHQSNKEAACSYIPKVTMLQINVCYFTKNHIQDLESLKQKPTSEMTLLHSSFNIVPNDVPYNMTLETALI